MEAQRKNSRKRQAILDLLCADRGHPTAEDIYSRLKPEFPELSLGTVYRNLAVLAADGEIVSVGKVEGQERYDANLTPHPHFICRRCWRVIDLTLPDRVTELYAAVEAGSGCTVEGYSLSFSGLCADCRDKSFSTAERR